MADRLTHAPYARPKQRPPRAWVWPVPDRYDGLLLPNQNSKAPPSVLVPFLDALAEAYDTPAGLLVIFNGPTLVDTGPYLPLRRMSSGGLTSYPDAPLPKQDTLECFLNGKPRHISRSNWTQIDLIRFWTLHPITLHRATPVPTLQLVTATTTKADVPDALKTVLAGSNPMADFRKAIGPLSPSMKHDLADVSKRVGVGALRTVFTLFLLFLAFFVMVSLIRMTAEAADLGGLIWLVPALLLAMMLYLFLRVIGMVQPPAAGQTRPVRGGGGGGGGGIRAQRQQRAAPREPNLLDKLSGWVIWNTPMGNSLRNKIDKRLAEMEKLLARGEIDEALKHALSAAEAKDTEPPTMASRLPDLRNSLDLDFGTKSQGGRFPLGDAAFHSMRARYTQLAHDCKASGDTTRAAFIYDELLGNHLQAMRILETAERFEDAAKLAMARNLSGGDIVRLWYLAGRRDIAIALAERYSCFDTLLAHVENKNKQAGHFIRAVWADRLAKSGDFLHALQVTDTVPNLEKQRLIWLANAIGAGDLDTPELFHRAVVLLPWNGFVLAGAALGDPNTVGGALEAKLHRVIGTPEETTERTALLEYLCMFSRGKKNPPFMSLPQGRILTDRLLRHVISDGIPLTQKSLKSYSVLARSAGLPVLGHDLHKIRRKAPVSAPNTDAALRLTDPAPGQPKWQFVLCLPHERLLLGDGQGLLRIRGRDGHVEWGDHVTDLAGFVQIGAGRYVLIILGTAAQPRRIVLLDTLRHTYTPLGRLALAAWHDTCNEQVWLVKSGDRVQALSVSALLSDTPAFTESWGVTITEDVVINRFFQEPNRVGWFMQRQTGPGQFGLIEYWMAATTNLRFATYLVSPSTSDSNGLNVYTDAVVAGPPFRAVEVSQVGRGTNGVRAYNWDAEQELAHEHRALLSILDTPADIRHYSDCPAALFEDREATTPLLRLTWKNGPLPQITLEATAILAMSQSRKDNRLVLIDRDHRLLLVDLNAKRLEALT